MKVYEFSVAEQAKIVKQFDKDFYVKMKKTLGLCSENWQLSVDNLLPYLSVNCIFTCYSEKYGEAILKIGKKYEEVATEAAMLTEYNGNRFCSILNADIENGALLIERLSPGKDLFYETTKEQRISAFAKLYNGIHIESHNATIYPTYKEWIERFISLAGNHDGVQDHGNKAMHLYHEIVQIYTKTMLLHGDLHHENILSDGEGYRIIDPKGVVGDPVFECSRFIMREFDYNLKTCKHIDILDFTMKLGEAINVPLEVLLKCLYIETVISMGEDLFYFNWLEQNMIDNTLQAEKLIK